MCASVQNGGPGGGSGGHVAIGNDRVTGNVGYNTGDNSGPGVGVTIRL